MRPMPDDIMSEHDMRMFYEFDDEEDVPDVVGVCAGEYRKTGDKWVFHKLEDDEE